MEHFLLLVPGPASQDAFSWGILFLLLIQCIDRTSGQPQVKLRQLRSISLKIRPLGTHFNSRLLFSIWRQIRWSLPMLNSLCTYATCGRLCQERYLYCPVPYDWKTNLFLHMVKRWKIKSCPSLLPCIVWIPTSNICDLFCLEDAPWPLPGSEAVTFFQISLFIRNSIYT
jgi:hypothetical protein